MDLFGSNVDDTHAARSFSDPRVSGDLRSLSVVKEPNAACRRTHYSTRPVTVTARRASAALSGVGVRATGNRESASSRPIFPFAAPAGRGWCHGEQSGSQRVAVSDVEARRQD